MSSLAQKEYHVFPVDGKTIKGSPEGDGSLNSPWDLQTALLQSKERVKGGDIIWLHEGIYRGNYKCTLQSNAKGKFITVSAYKDDKVVIDGNVENKLHYVLEVNSSRVVFKNFEITYVGSFSRERSSKAFKAATGINHVAGEDCKFQNLIIRNIPGSGFGSWKATGGSIIEDCIIYNNGYQGHRGQGVGIYVQNQSDKTRVIRSNIIFNNYYKGIEVWSASSGSNKEFVKNVKIEGNIIFNNGNPSGKPWANLIVASGDKEGLNVAKNIMVKNNVFYHNVDFNDIKNYGYGNSITLGYTAQALAEDISIVNNVIIGRNNALNILHAKSLEFKNNTVYTGYIHFKKSTLLGLETGKMEFDNNTYHTRKVKGFRILNHKDFKLFDWKNKFNIDGNSQWKALRAFSIKPVLKVVALHTKSNMFNVALLQKEGENVTVDFSEFNMKKGTSYRVYDIESKEIVVKSGALSDDKKIKFPMILSKFEQPLHNTKAVKSPNNFGVYRIVFDLK